MKVKTYIALGISIILALCMFSAEFRDMGLNASTHLRTSASIAPYDWPTHGYDPACTGFSPSTAPNENTTAWITDLAGGTAWAYPVVAEGKVFIGAGGYLNAFDEGSGKLLWQYLDPDQPGYPCCSAAANGMVFFGTGEPGPEGCMYALNATTGELLWKFTTEFYLRAPVVAENRLYFGVDTSAPNEGKIYCVNATTGAHIWNFTTQDKQVTVAVAYGKIFAGCGHWTTSATGCVYCLDMYDGSLVWSFQTNRDITGMVAVANGKVYLSASYEGWDCVVFALNATNGEEVWRVTQYSSGDAARTAVAYGKVFVNFGYGVPGVYALNETNGDEVWAFPASPGVIGGPVIADGKVFFARGYPSHTFYALNETNGAVVWTYELAGSVHSWCSAIADGRVFVADNWASKLYAFGPSGPVHNLNTGLGYASIQEAIDANETLDGHTILVDSGTYNEDVNINKSIFLTGTDEETTFVNSTLGINIAAGSVTVTHFTISQGVLVHDSDNARVEHNIIVSTYRGIELTYSNNSQVSGNNIYGLSDYCYGVMLRHCYSCGIQNNIVTNMTAGIGVERSENNSIVGNKVFGYSQLITEDVGLALNEASHNVFLENTIEQCQKGVLLLPLTEENAFYHNNFLDYVQPADIWSGAGSNTLDDGYPCGGNYWSGYNGTDLYSGPSQNETGNDGIGDTPYVLDANNIDHYPLVKLFISGEHDLAAFNITTSKTGCKPMPTLGQNQELSINVTIENQGSYTEIFNATIYANATLIGTLDGRTLGSGDSRTFAFVWGTSGFAYGNYTLAIFVEPVSNETNTGNNVVLTWIIITIPGDLNGDFTVDIYDAIMLAGAYNSVSTSLNWNLNADINGDGIVDIYDAIILAGHFNQHVP